MALSPEMRVHIRERQGNTCFYCKRSITRKFVLDHLIPRYEGGPDGNRNRVAACKPCDQAKKNRMPTTQELERQVEIIGRVANYSDPKRCDRSTLMGQIHADGWDLVV